MGKHSKPRGFRGDRWAEFLRFWLPTAVQFLSATASLIRTLRGS